jgi:hypothetical protein
LRIVLFARWVSAENNFHGGLGLKSREGKSHFWVVGRVRRRRSQGNLGKFLKLEKLAKNGKWCKIPNPLAPKVPSFQS